jgi:hypothetical protein
MDVTSPLRVPATPPERPLFTPAANRVARRVLWGAVVPAVALSVGVPWYYFTAKYLEVGYQPEQPVEFSHKLHAGDLGMDCRACHHTVEWSPFAAVPSTQSCMDCHARVLPDSVKVAPLRDAHAADTPLRWVRVHRLPDYVQLDHRAHLLAGVGCSSCHGRVDRMPRVTQVEPLTMAWCLDCHRRPGPSLRPRDQVTNLAWEPDPGRAHVNQVVETGREVSPPLHCSGCHT